MICKICRHPKSEHVKDIPSANCEHCPIKYLNYDYDPYKLFEPMDNLEYLKWLSR